MRDILDPKNVWLGAPIGEQNSSNKPPVALDDALVIEQDSGPVTIAVLDNDFDPEGGTLSLISAFAALGSAVAEANNTVTYTPPSGVWGSDTVVYEVIDDLGLQSSAQINVQITEPELTIAVSSENTLIIEAGTGAISVTITDPPEFAGTYQTDTSQLTGGPVNLSPPGLSGLVDSGETLTASGGLWIHEIGAGTLTQSWQWHRNGAEIAGATGGTYTVQAQDIGQTITVFETMTDGAGQRMAESAAAALGFVPSDDPGLLVWHAADDAATLTTNGSDVTVWASKAGGTALIQNSIVRRPSTGTRQINGLNAIDFDGSNYIGGNISLPASGNIAVHMVVEIDSVTNLYESIVAMDANGDFQIDANSDTQFDGRLNTTAVASPVTLSGGPFSGAMILSVVFDRTGAAQIEVFINNALRGSSAYTTALDVSQELLLMTNRSKNSWLDGAVGEVIVTNSLNNRADFHDYLAAKWGFV